MILLNLMFPRDFLLMVAVDWWNFVLMMEALDLRRRLTPTSLHRTTADREIAVAVVMSQWVGRFALVVAILFLFHLLMVGIADRRTDNLARVTVVESLIEKRRAAHIAVWQACIAVDQLRNFLILPSTVVDHIHYMLLGHFVHRNNLLGTHCVVVAAAAGRSRWLLATLGIGTVAGAAADITAVGRHINFFVQPLVVNSMVAGSRILHL